MFSEEDKWMLKCLERMNEEFNKEYIQYQKLKKDYNQLKIQYAEVKETEVPKIGL